jgi:D-inositol-3-phosphate glycosyltransferase
MVRKIAVISEHASPLASVGGTDSGGQNVYVAQVARHLARLGHKVDVFTRRDGSRLPEVVDWKDGVRIIHITAGPPRHVRKEELLPYMDEFTDQCHRFMGGRPGYDIIHANFWMSGLVAADIKQRLGIPFVVTFHALGRVRRLYQGVEDQFPSSRPAIEERIIAEADAIIAECPQDEEDLASLYSARSGKVVAIPCGFDPAEFWPMDRFLARRELGLPKQDFTVLQLGRVVPRKGIDTVIRGFARIAADHSKAAQLIIVGGESTALQTRTETEMSRLRQVAVEEGVEDLVSFVGRRSRERLRYYYNAADVFVTTPWYEPFGITPLEAMACGVPVIGSEVGGIKYSVADGETGYLIPAKDHEKLAQVLSYLYTHPTVRERLGREGINRVNGLFTWQKVVASIGELYEDVIAGARKTPPSREDRTLLINRSFEAIVQALQDSRRLLCSPIIEAAEMIIRCFERGDKVLACGNGGSAADAQHFVAELVGRFRHRTRPGLPALALSADSAILTASSNDLGYENVFARQVQAFGRPGDVLLCISTTGQSPNIIKACRQAHESRLSCVALLGAKGGELVHEADLAILVPASDAQRVQEVQLVALHLLCEIIEEQMVMNSSYLARAKQDRLEETVGSERLAVDR